MKVKLGEPNSNDPGRGKTLATRLQVNIGVHRLPNQNRYGLFSAGRRTKDCNKGGRERYSRVRSGSEGRGSRGTIAYGTPCYDFNRTKNILHMNIARNPSPVLRFCQYAPHYRHPHEFDVIFTHCRCRGSYVSSLLSLMLFPENFYSILYNLRLASRDFIRFKCQLQNYLKVAVL